MDISYFSDVKKFRFPSNDLSPEISKGITSNSAQELPSTV